jgi:hypothetical protein
MLKTKILTNGAILVLFAIMVAGLFLISRDALVLLRGRTTQATVLTQATSDCGDVPHIRYTDDAGHVHVVANYDIFTCPFSLQSGQSIEILYLPDQPGHILLAQDRVPLTSIFCVLGAGILVILLLIALMLVVAVRSKVTPGEVLYRLFIRSYLDLYKRPQKTMQKKTL